MARFVEGYGAGEEALRRVGKLEPSMVGWLEQFCGFDFSADAPRVAYCERILGGSVSLLLRPAIESGELKSLAFIRESTQDLQQFKARFKRLVVESGIVLPSIRVVETEGFVVLVSPWFCRCEFRALVIHAGSGDTLDFTEVISDFDPSGYETKQPLPDGDVASLLPPSDVDTLVRKSVPGLKAFVAGYDRLVLRIWKKFSGGEVRRNWKFPWGCSVDELLRSGGAEWHLGFSDFEMVERVQMLVDAFLVKHSMDFDLLGQTIHTSTHGHETKIEGVYLRAHANTKDARKQMAKMLKNIFGHLDQFGYLEPPRRRKVDIDLAGQ